MEKSLKSLFIMAVFTAVYGCTTARFAEDRNEKFSTEDTLTLSKGQVAASAAGKKENGTHYRSSYMLMFLKTDKASAVNNGTAACPYLSS